MKIYATVYSTQRETHSYNVDLLPPDWEKMDDFSRWNWLEMNGYDSEIEDSVMIHVDDVENVGP